MKLFILSTPSQAFFLSKTTNIVKENAVLLITKNKEGVDKKIISQLKAFPWIKILIWDIIGIENPTAYYKIFLFRFKLALFVRKYHKINKLYIGSYDNFFHLSIAAVFEDNAKMYLLYDGLQIVSVARKRMKDIKKSLRPYTKPFMWAGFKTPTLESITYTSPLNFKVPSFDKVIKIEGESNKSVALKDDLMYFAGQPLPDMGLVSVENFLNKLNRLKTKFPMHQIIYIPHPKESDQIKKKISEIFEIKNFEVIFEQEYLKAKIFPKKIVSFYSSVLINLYYLSQGDLHIYSIELLEEELLLPESRKRILSIYKYFRFNQTLNFEVIKI